MNRLIKTLLLMASLTLLNVSAFAAKEEAKAASADKATAAAATGNKASSKSDTATSKDKSSALLDLNTASEKDLATLPQIGEARAKAIVAGRPYARKDELVSKKIVSQKVYDGFKDKVIAKQGSAAGKKM